MIDAISVIIIVAIAAICRGMAHARRAALEGPEPASWRDMELEDA